MRKQPLEELRVKKHGDDVGRRQIHGEDVLVLDLDEVLEALCLDFCARLADERCIDLEPAGLAAVCFGC